MREILLPEARKISRNNQEAWSCWFILDYIFVLKMKKEVYLYNCFHFLFYFADKEKENDVSLVSLF